MYRGIDVADAGISLLKNSHINKEIIYQEVIRHWPVERFPDGIAAAKGAHHCSPEDALMVLDPNLAADVKAFLPGNSLIIDSRIKHPGVNQSDLPIPEVSGQA